MQQPDPNTHANDTGLWRKRPNNYVVAAAVGLVGIVTWLTAEHGGSACAGGGCLIPPLTILAAANADSVATSDSKAIIAAVEGFHAALIRGDAEAAMKMLAPNAIILESGASQTREEYAREHLAEDIAFAKATSSTRLTLNVGQEGKAAWTISTYQTNGSFEPKPIDIIAAELVVLTQSPDGWRIRSIHWSSRKRPNAK
ncbi:MAG TPA: nuclear transport factor 2 family protein [Verrucomicrobiae bacterium]|jgi:ketosteroid isomerase-like protein|nr:nuclear transport factor 2 family protein [Verrucomicrobiae bacterium]